MNEYFVCVLFNDVSSSGCTASSCRTVVKYCSRVVSSSNPGTAVSR